MSGEEDGKEYEDKRGVCVQAQCRKQGLLFSTPTTPTPYAPQCARERGTRAALVRLGKPSSEAKRLHEPPPFFAGMHRATNAARNAGGPISSGWICAKPGLSPNTAESDLIPQQFFARGSAASNPAWASVTFALAVTLKRPGQSFGNLKFAPARLGAGAGDALTTGGAGM